MLMLTFLVFSQFNISFIRHAKDFKLNDTFEYGGYLYFDAGCLN